MAIPEKIIDFEAHYLDKEIFAMMQGRKDPPYYHPDTKLFVTATDLPDDAVLAMDPSRLLDVDEGRIAAMDEAGISVQILSSTIPLESCFSPGEATAQMAGINTRLAEIVARHPNRYRGIASLSPHDPAKAAVELRRCVKELGFVGWHLHSHIADAGVPYADHEKYLPIWEAAAELDIYVYIHPSPPSLPALHGYGYELFGSPFGFAIDASICMARLLLSGLFERFPTLKVMQGHLGEAFPLLVERMDHQIATKAIFYKLPKLPGDYWRNNVWCSTSGCYSPDAFTMLRSQMSLDHVVLGSDYPYENPADSTKYLTELPLTENERANIGYRSGAALGIRLE
jgi:Predicted metal-dependent hydrolase of the TIM-barrel fold